MKKLLYLCSAVAVALLVNGCSVLGKATGNSGGGFNLFPISKDKELGAQTAQQIESNPTEYPIIDSASNVKLYSYVYAIRNKILNSGEVVHKDDFPWRVRLINNDTILNAFCTPGGYIYIYTGLMKYLSSEDELAGVLGHEMGHADLRHSTEQMTKIYGVQTLLNFLAGDHTLIKNLATNIIGLKFSRDDEAEADAASVRYLCPTDYNADGAAKFFEKIEKEQKSSAPEWLSTHPSPAHRIEHFHTLKTSLGCKGTQTYQSRYQQMIKLIPAKTSTTTTQSGGIPGLHKK